MGHRAVLLQTIDPVEAQMVEHFAQTFQVTTQDAVRALIRMATCALESRDANAVAFARHITDDFKHGYDRLADNGTGD